MAELEDAKRVNFINTNKTNETYRASGFNSQYRELEATKAKLKNKLAANDFAAIELIDAHESSLGEIVNFLNSDPGALNDEGLLYSFKYNPLYGVTSKHDGSRYPFWLHGLFDYQIGDTASEDVATSLPGGEGTNPIGDTRVIGQIYPSTHAFVGVGPDSDLTLSIMFHKATAWPPVVAGDNIYRFSTESRTQAYYSTLGIWAIHAPFNGFIDSVIQRASGTELSLKFEGANDPYFRGDPYGYGWSNTTASAWGAPQEAYWESLLGTNAALTIAYRYDTGFLTTSYGVMAITASASSIDVYIEPAFEPTNLTSNSHAYAFTDTVTGKGKYDTASGWTSLFSWSNYYKTSDGNWKSHPAAEEPPGGYGAFMSGSNLFYSSKPSQQVTGFGASITGKDLFYRVNVDPTTMRCNTLSRVTQYQASYSTMIREISSITSGFSREYESYQGALTNMADVRSVYQNPESPQTDNGVFGSYERYLTLLRTSASTAIFKMPIDHWEYGDIPTGFNVVLLTGALAVACPKTIYNSEGEVVELDDPE